MGRGQGMCPKGYTCWKCSTTMFVVSDDYEIHTELGQGAYGVVCSGVHMETRAAVAVKQIRLLDRKYRYEDRYRHALRALREIRLMKYFHHDNIVRLYDIIRPPTSELSDLYLVMDLMSTDLGSVLHPRPPGKRQKLTPRHIEHFMYQLLDGVGELHRRGVMHRDLKPQNILVNEDCSMKICDFGLAREVSGSEKTVYVETRWYRAPELILEYDAYTSAVDIWSVGCIFAEILAEDNAPLFRGRNQLEQMNLICGRLGVPCAQELSVLELSEQKAQRYLNDHRETDAAQGLKGLCDDAVALDLLEDMLRFMPAARRTAPQCLEHPYFRGYKRWLDEQDDYEDEECVGQTECAAASSASAAGSGDAKTEQPLTPFDLQFDNSLADAKVNYERVIELILEEITQFHPSIDAPADAAGGCEPHVAREVELEHAGALDDLSG